MFKDMMLDNLTIGILILDKFFKVKYINKEMKKILKENEVDCNSKLFLETILGISKYEIKSYEVKYKNESLFQLEFHKIENNSKNKLVTMLDTVQDFIFYLDSHGRIEYFNKAYSNFLGKSHLEILGKKESEFFSKDMAKKCDSNNDKALEKGHFYEEEYLDGKWFQTFKSRVELGNGDYGIFGMVKDITDSKKRTLDLKEKIYKDILTEIYNRNFYEDKVQELFKRRKHEIFSIMLIDIDKFKEINDTKGHDIGDLVLKKLSKILKKNVRKSNDFIIRMGGDELAIIIKGTLKHLKIILERIKKDILEENSFEDLKFNISIGMAEREENESLDSLYKKADIELYKMKNKK